ncbi:GNAT family N-acetyltransferase [Streptacidiphilus griseoplanus]|uniref:GNAT family N-acetyltransferase n=1 Tax=Peterkaempfera griseoplana TaxID=66896 RepID=UPI0006E31F1D|nr:GNAT family N-acetyltransferase [Peterkaempfera griseoplana]
MTTTLRPDGPEEALPDGGRTRRYSVCANGRPVGGVRVTAGGPAGVGRRGLQGGIAELEITEGRRRGRGTVAVLAAEEVLRGWDCTRVDADIPEECTAALRLALALGYRERSRTMVKHLVAEPPALPAGLRARPIGEAEFPGWAAAGEERYIGELVASGLTEEQARAKSADDHRRLLPDGPHTRDTLLTRLLPEQPADAEPLGDLWVQLRGRTLPGGEDLAWVLSVDVAEQARGRGHGRALMLLAERACLAEGVRHLGLNVFADNPVAGGLYGSLGYRTTARRLGKRLL